MKKGKKTQAKEDGKIFRGSKAATGPKNNPRKGKQDAEG